jgi:uncharacterized protein (DUF983 family)
MTFERDARGRNGGFGRKDAMAIEQQVSPWIAGLTCRCPRCGKGRLFSGFLRVAKCCQVCGLDYSFVDTGDGPAVFIMLIVGFIVTGAALIVEMAYSPPYWVHAVLWVPLAVGLPLLILRPFKATLIALQYANKAAEGRLQ